MQVVTPTPLGTQLRLDATEDGAILTIGATLVFDMAEPDAALDAAVLPALLDAVLPPDVPLDTGDAKPAAEILVLASEATAATARRLACGTVDRRVPAGTDAGVFGPDAASPLPWHDADWAARFPVLPAGEVDAHTSVAPEDQRLSGFAEPGLPFRLEGFTGTPLQGRLPAVAVRCLALRRGAGPEESEEIAMAVDTVVLVPERGRGLVIARGRLRGADRDAEDVTALLLACEPAAAPRPVDHYRAELARRIDRAQGALLAFDERPLVADAVSEEPDAAPSRRDGVLRRLLDHRIAAICDAAGVTAPAREEPGDEPGPTVSVAALAARRADLAGLVDHADTRVTAARDAATALAERADADRGDAIRALGPPPAEPANRPAWPALPPPPDDAAGEDALAGLRHRLDALAPAFAAARRLSPRPAAGPIDPDIAAARRRILLTLVEAGEPVSGRDLSGADLSGLDLSGLDLAGAVLDRADLSDAVLARIDLHGAALVGARLDRADLRNARLDDAGLAGATAVAAVLAGASLARARLPGAAFAEADLTGADLTDVEAGAADFDGARLDDARLDGAFLLRAALAGASLRGARLDGAILLEARLAGADLTGASLRRACLIGADASGARLDDADLAELQAGDAAFAGASLVRVRGERSAWRGADMSRADLARARLAAADLGRARLAGARLALAGLRGAILASADLTDADCRRADLLGAVLRRARLDGTDLRQANLYDTEVDAAALAAAHLDGANLPPTLRPARPAAAAHP